MSAWMIYAAAVGGLLAAAAASGEAVLRAVGRPRRWAWAVAIPASLLVPLVAGSLRPGGAAPEEPVTIVAATVSVAGASAVPARGPSVAERVEPLMPVRYYLCGEYFDQLYRTAGRLMACPHVMMRRDTRQGSP